MAHKIVMPSLGMYTAEAKLIRWLRPTGTRVEAGEPVVEIETEKAIHELEAPACGIVHAVAQPEDMLPVEALIGYVLADGESAPANDGAAIGSAASATPVATRTRTPARDIRATPIARRLASEHNIDLAFLTGSGPGGRIVEADVRAAIADTRAPDPAASSTLRIREKLPVTAVRRTIAERLRYAFEQAVPLTLTREVRADRLQGARSLLAKMGLTISYDTLFIKMLAVALRRDLRLNASIQNESLCVYDSINVGFAVAIRDGLLVPTVRNADDQSLAEIEKTVRRLSEAARAGRLSSDDTLAGTITLTNLGGYGIDAFTPVLNPPQAAILGIGRILDRPVVEEDRVVVGKACVLSLTFDHRVCDGAPAAELLGAMVALMSDEKQLIAWA